MLCPLYYNCIFYSFGWKVYSIYRSGDFLFLQTKALIEIDGILNQIVKTLREKVVFCEL